MAIERVFVCDHKELGEKLIELAKHEAVIPEKGDMKTDDISLEDINIDDLKKYFGDNVKFPAHITKVTLVQAKNKTELIIKLPPKEMLEDSFDIMAQAGTYPLPPFYEDIVFRVAPQDNLDKKAVLAMRVGDYDIGQCT